MRCKRVYLYLIFAALSTIINIVVQWIVRSFIEIVNVEYFDVYIINPKLTVGFWITLFCATVSGFVFKYISDKVIVFRDKTDTYDTKHFKMILLYGLFAVFTTIIFYLFSAVFRIIIKEWYGSYIGSIAGLTIGYIVKYHLDSRYVFNRYDKSNNCLDC